MAKYIIEIEDESTNGLYKAKNFNALVFDEIGLGKLTPYEEPKQEKPKRWRAVLNGEYFYVCGEGKVYSGYDCRKAVDDWNYQSGNYFENEEEAEEYKESLVVYNEMKAFAEPDDFEWNTDKGHYFIAYDNYTCSLDKCWSNRFKGGRLYFSSKEAIQATIEAVGAERIKKYYLGVKD